MELNKIWNGDCMEYMRQLPDGCVDLIVTDPPYEFKETSGAGAFGYGRGKASGNGGCTYHGQLSSISQGITNEVLDEMLRILKKGNMYLFCNKDQVPQYLNWGISHNLNFDILTWHKPNVVPACGNKYLSDTEYIIFLREKGVKVYGSAKTKHKYFITNTNVGDKKLYLHPTIKPLSIIETLIINSSLENDVVFDPYMGSGTTAVACIKQNRKFIGCEIDGTYYDIACKRIKNVQSINPLF